MEHAAIEINRPLRPIWKKAKSKKKVSLKAEKSSSLRTMIARIGYLYCFMLVLLAGLFLCLSLEAANKYIRNDIHSQNASAAMHKGKKHLPITKEELNQSVEFAISLVEKLATHEQNIDTAGVRVEDHTLFYSQLLDSLPSEEALEFAKDAVIALKTTQHLANKHCAYSNNDDQCFSQVYNLNLRDTVLGSRCLEAFESIKCSSSDKFRTMDGSCNHLAVPAYGRSNTAYRRLLKPDYDNKLFAVRGSQLGSRELPSARVVTTTMTEDREVPEKTKTLAVALWGIFIGQDMAFTPTSNMVTRKTPITCCTSDGRPLSPRYSHSACAPISIPKDDPFYGPFYQTCMNYVRSVPALRVGCKLGPLEQINQATHFLDGSVIYGSTPKRAQTLRAFKGGKLLPEENRSKKCYHYKNSSLCYNDGNSRVLFQPQLRAIHTVFVNEHNRIAEKLAAINKHWNDETLYQEARRIVVAEMQHITYNHWLPTLLGEKYVRNSVLTTPVIGYSKTYDKRLDPTVSNVFATAALPSLNSMINGDIGLYTEDRVVGSVTYLRDHIAADGISRHELTDFIIRGLVTQSSQKLDVKYSSFVTRYWYSPSEEYGMDALSLDIQRGRDHGLPGYVQYRKACNLSVVTSFDDLNGIMNEQIVELLKSVYKKVEHVDVLIGMIAEEPTKDALVGPTLQCVLSEQFFKSKAGDRYFYDNANESGSFTEYQLIQIKKSNLARIFCDNTKGVGSMQLDVFQKPDALRNKLVFCKDPLIKSVNLDVWKEA